MTHFELIDKLFWAAGFALEFAVFISWCSSTIWKPVCMVGIYSAFRAAADAVMFGIWLVHPAIYERAGWAVFGLGYILMGFLAVELSEVNRRNRANRAFTFYCILTVTAILVAVVTSLFPLVPTPVLLKLARFADGVCLITLIPGLRKTMPRPYARLVLVFMFLLAADFGCSQWQALDKWHHWDLIARAYSTLQFAGWVAFLAVLRAGRSHPYYRPASIATHA